MTTEVHGLTPVQETLFLTLRGRARDARATKPILRDSTAAEVVEALDGDPAGSKLPGSLVVQVALRAKMLDAAVRRFTVEHPDAVVVELGAGLDSRRIRVAPAPTVDWYDVDFPQVVVLRERLLPPAALGHQVGRSLTDPGWTDTIPADRPTVLVADGLLAFLTEAQIVALLHHITDHFGHGELVFNDYGKLVVSTWLMRLRSITKTVARLKPYAGFNDPLQIERWEPRLHLVQEASLTRAPEVALFPPVLRIATRLSGLNTTLARKARILRYRF